MSRSLRVDYEGAWHHVMNRGGGRAAIYHDDNDRRGMLALLQEVPDRFGVEVHAYCLMGNHYHLLLRSKSGRLSEAMRHVDGVYTLRHNRRHATDGALFRGRFASRLIEEEHYLFRVVAYVHRNPVAAGLVQSCTDYRWSSHPAYVGLARRPAWLSVDEIGAQFSSPAAFTETVDHLSPEGTSSDNTLEPVPGWFGLRRHDERDAPTPSPAPPPPRDVLGSLATVMGVEPDALRQGRPGVENIERMVAALVLNQACAMTYDQIAETLSYNSRHAVARALARIQRRAASDAEVARLLTTAHNAC